MSLEARRFSKEIKVGNLNKRNEMVVRVSRRLMSFKPLLLIALLCLIFLFYVSNWNTNLSKVLDQKTIDTRQIIQGKLAELVAERDGKILNKDNKPVDEGDYDVIDLDDKEFQEKLNPQKKQPKKMKRKMKRKMENVKSRSMHENEKLVLSEEILQIHQQLGLNNPGHMGQPVILPDNLPYDIQRRVNESWDRYQINEFIASIIPLDRELPDIRTDYCKNVIYSENLPVTSVIMVFHNEPFSMILRSMHSVINRSPPHLLGEIVFVDDCSEHENLKKPFEDYISQYPKVKLVRSPVRVGLIKARMIGAVNAKGPALVFMDSHCEVAPGWLEPLIDRIALNKNASTMPVVDTLVAETLEYRYNPDPSSFAIGGFEWNMIYEWKGVPDFERIKHKDLSEPIWSPTMLGAFFVIDKDYFELLGLYDPEFDIWGAENLELSFKVWMCGGTLELIPCSHAGHMYRKKFPYTWPKGGNVVWRNTDRLAEVWLDDYKRYYYRKMGNHNNDFGDISKQKQLRTDLGCKSFQWFLDNIYPDVKIPDDITDPPPAVAADVNNQN